MKTDNLAIHKVQYLDILAYTFPLIFRCIKVYFTLFSIDKIPRVTSPVLVIHGTEDEVSHIFQHYPI